MFKNLTIELDKATVGDAECTPGVIYKDDDCVYKYIDKVVAGDLCVIYKYSYFTDAIKCYGSTVKTYMIIRKVTPIEYMLGFIVSRYKGFKKIELKDFYTWTYAYVDCA